MDLSKNFIVLFLTHFIKYKSVPFYNSPTQTGRQKLFVVGHPISKLLFLADLQLKLWLSHRHDPAPLS